MEYLRNFLYIIVLTIGVNSSLFGNNSDLVESLIKFSSSFHNVTTPDYEEIKDEIVPVDIFLREDCYILGNEYFTEIFSPDIYKDEYYMNIATPTLNINDIYKISFEPIGLEYRDNRIVNIDKYSFELPISLYYLKLIYSNPKIYMEINNQFKTKSMFSKVIFDSQLLEQTITSCELKINKALEEKYKKDIISTIFIVFGVLFTLFLIFIFDKKIIKRK